MPWTTRPPLRRAGLLAQCALPPKAQSTARRRSRHAGRREIIGEFGSELEDTKRHTSGRAHSGPHRQPAPTASSRRRVSVADHQDRETGDLMSLSIDGSVSTNIPFAFPPPWERGGGGGWPGQSPGRSSATDKPVAWRVTSVPRRPTRSTGLAPTPCPPLRRTSSFLEGMGDLAKGSGLPVFWQIAHDVRRF